MLLFRETQVQMLDRFLHTPNFRTLAIYGRKRIGKTFLMTNYMASHATTDFLYFQCVSNDYRTCLQDFLRVAAIRFPEHMLLSRAATFREAIDYITRLSEKPLCLVIDGFPFLARTAEVVSEFRDIIDHHLHGKKLVLLGSDCSVMKQLIQQPASLLHGRFDMVMEVPPFSFPQIQTLYPSFSDAVQVYALTGGVPQYVAFLMDSSSLREAISSLFFHLDGRLLEEAHNLLLGELRDTTTYENILRAIGGGEKTLSQIATQCDMESKALYAYVNKLVALDLVRQVNRPFSEKQRDRRYCISDMLFRFHYTFLAPNMSLIHSRGADAITQILSGRYDEYLGFVYKDIIRASCMTCGLNGKLPFVPVTVGKWWGIIQDGNGPHESEIDVVACDDHHILFGDCLYRSAPAGIHDLMELEYKAHYVSCGRREIFFLVASKSGFTPELAKLTDHILLLSPV